LQFLIKIIKLCGFEYKLVSNGSAFFKEVADRVSALYTQELSGGVPSLEVRVQDGLGREWALSYLKFEREALIVSLFNRLERFIALLIEQREGVPFWLAPEQIRLFSLGTDLDEYGELVLKRLQLEGFRAFLDCSNEKFSKRLHEALRERVPYTMVLGKREKETGLLTLRELSTREEKRLTLEDLVKILSNRNCV